MYMPTVGLEIHAELKTATKMFCDSRNDSSEARPNQNICPICLGHPGTLPTINREAVKRILKVGLALGGELANFTEFDRKNYFYPDIPKGYQLSQYASPLVAGGSLHGVAITRVHLEEDTATSLHEERDHSLINFNRAGVPLMELVTEPVIRSAKEAGDFARGLQLLLRYLGVSDANMEKGEMRVEANVSVSADAAQLGTKVEVKNLNSFRAVERAILYEAERQSALLELGETILQETRGWDENTGKTFSQRRKEASHDYRYFPDPDLPKLVLKEIPEFDRRVLQKEMPELPSSVHSRYLKLGLKTEDAETLVANRALASLFEEAAKKVREKKQILLSANYITSDLLGLIKKDGADADLARFRFTGEAFAELIGMAATGRISSRGAKDILRALFERGGSPAALAEELSLLQKNDAGELERVVRQILEENQKVATEYRNGKGAALQFLIGRGMKETKGAGNPEKLRELFVTLLKE